MTYEVYVKRFIGWKKYKKVKGDTMLEAKNGQQFAVRIIIFEDETRMEIPFSRIIKFGPNRHLFIQKQMSQEAGQQINMRN